MGFFDPAKGAVVEARGRLAPAERPAFGGARPGELGMSMPTRGRPQCP
jgi:hypothetical protein